MQKIKGVVHASKMLVVEEVADLWVTDDGKQFRSEQEAKDWEERCRMKAIFDGVDTLGDFGMDWVYGTLYVVRNNDDLNAVIRFARYGGRIDAPKPKLSFPAIIWLEEDYDDKNHLHFHRVIDVTEDITTLYEALTKGKK